ncbi:hypothetical protein BUZ91_13445, partial [Mammaliicoccus sciuri]|uniref:trypsin-like serine peptidase n=1 Tax=Mammaliicoccus sciuri TaxID=1296 RepID=UPI000FF0B394
MKKFILLITFLSLINISIISNQAFAEESNQSGQQISDSNLNESNISNIDIDKYENEDLNTNLETDNNTNEDVENEEPNISTSAIAVESENNNDVENNENNENNSEIQNTQPENNSIEKANVEIENSESTSSENISSGEEKFNDEKSSLSLEKIDVNQGKNEAINNVAESIIGQDDRKIVRDLIKAPNKSIVHISSYVNDSILYGGGTGFLIDNYTVLTAAHVITSDYIDYPINKIIIEAGYKDEKATFGTANVIKTYVMPEWKNFRNYFFDMAILIIDKPLGKDLGKLNIIDEVTLGEFISTTGYPGSNKNNIDKIKKGNQYYSSGKIVNITKNKIYYDSDTEPGQSGSPVFNINNDVIAIHTRGFNENDSYKYNSGIRLSSTNIETINEWKNELKIEDFNKYIYINEKNAKVWKDLNFNELYKNDKDILVRVYKACILYTSDAVDAMQ